MFLIYFILFYLVINIIYNYYKYNIYKIFIKYINSIYLEMFGGLGIFGIGKGFRGLVLG